MEQLVDPAFYAEEMAAARRWLEANAVAVGLASLVQLLVIGLAFYAARLSAPRLRAMLAKTARGRFEPQLVRLTRALEPPASTCRCR